MTRDAPSWKSIHNVQIVCIEKIKSGWHDRKSLAHLHTLVSEMYMIFMEEDGAVDTTN